METMDRLLGLLLFGVTLLGALHAQTYEMSETGAGKFTAAEPSRSLPQTTLADCQALCAVNVSQCAMLMFDSAQDWCFLYYTATEPGTWTDNAPYTIFNKQEVTGGGGGLGGGGGGLGGLGGFGLENIDRDTMMMIVGGSVGGALALLCLILGICLCYRRECCVCCERPEPAPAQCRNSMPMADPLYYSQPPMWM